ncbi:MAG: glycosyltransferase, partial [Candidatus Dojkabacteria bacterium]|nr:glycosyltransferase [Candidatus Dojkabacteria bacterium]
MKITEYGWKRFKTRFPMWIKQALTIIRRDGIIALIVKSTRKVSRVVKYSSDPHALNRVLYGDWIKNVESHYLNDGYQRRILHKIKKKTKFSIIFPTWNKSDEMISTAIDSVLAQTYDNWELCISEGSTEHQEQTRILLESYVKKHPDKIKLTFLKDVLDTVPPVNIVENTNNAIEMATGEFCVFMDCDDTLSENCLLELARAIEQNPKVEFLYSDFDKIDEDDNRFDPAFWPDWSPHTLLSSMYTTHVSCYRRDMLDQLGGIRDGTEGAQDWDLVLRLRERVDRTQVVHIPKILYHWRVYAGSTSMPNSGAKDWAYESQKNVLQDWIQRNNEKALVEEGIDRINQRVKFEIAGKAHGKPRVAIIIPFRDNVTYLKRCVRSIIKKTVYDNYELLLVDNQSKEPATLNYLERLKEQVEHTGKSSKGEEIGSEKTRNQTIRILSYDHPYHFGRLNNWAARQTDADHVLFLNNDTKVLTDEWLTAMLEYSQRKEIACVGAKLLYPDNRVQHAGVILGLGGAAAHSHRMVPNSSPGYNGWLVSVR